jgi:dihydroorotate dehydrogenase electron transfer subunit
LLININKIRSVVIEDVIPETPSVKTFIFKDRMSHRARAGQFLMLWIPGKEELPMSIMLCERKDRAAVTVRRLGYGSTALYKKEVGETIGIRGPYGNFFTVPSTVTKALLVGGGTGLAPLMRLAKTLSEHKTTCTVIIGAKTKHEVFFETFAANLLSNTRHGIVVTTDDGSYGLEGKATDAMTSIIGREKFDMVYTCGPEPMMREVFNIASSHSLPIQASLERHMKCGIGICASCCIDDYLVCKDGTIFDQDKLANIKDFGKTYRDKSGKKISFS